MYYVADIFQASCIYLATLFPIDFIYLQRILCSTFHFHDQVKLFRNYISGFFFYCLVQYKFVAILKL